MPLRKLKKKRPYRVMVGSEKEWKKDYPKVVS